MLFALGLGDDVVAVTHECDFPPEAAVRPHITRSVIPEGLAAGAIDRAVRERTEAGEALYALDEHLLAELAPDLIVTQALCEVCAVSFDDVRAAAERLSSEPQVISLDPTTLGEVLSDVPRLAEATGVPEAGERLVADAARRLDAVAE
nr:cobalamin-binding protein [Actinomycetota bacterium]